MTVCFAAYCLPQYFVSCDTFDLGGELYDRLASRKRYSEADAAEVTVQMLEAVNYCHYHHICHRDLK